MHFQTNRQLSVTPLQQTLPFLWSCLTLAPSLMILAALAGCGPATSDNSPNSVSRANVDRRTISKQVPPPGNNPFTPVTQATSQVPLASVINGTGSTSGTETVVGEDKLAVPSIPDSIVKDFGSPDALTRYRALNHWETKGPQAPLDPVFEALEDDDPAVRADAAAIVEQYVAKQ